MEINVSRAPVKSQSPCPACCFYCEKYRRKCHCPGWRLLRAGVRASPPPHQTDRRSAGGRSHAVAALLAPPATADLMQENLLLHPPQQVEEEPDQPSDLTPPTPTTPPTQPPFSPGAAGWVRVHRRKEGSRRIWLADAQTREKLETWCRWVR